MSILFAKICLSEILRSLRYNECTLARSEGRCMDSVRKHNLLGCQEPGKFGKIRQIFKSGEKSANFAKWSVKYQENQRKVREFHDFGFGRFISPF